MALVANAVTRVNSFTSGDQRGQQITKLTDGGWVVTWQSSSQDSDLSGSSAGVYQQRYGVDGAKVGGEVHVNSYTESSQSAPKIAALSNGGWVVTWNSHAQDGDDSSVGVYQQAFSSSGGRIGGETQVNVVTDLGQQDPLPVSLADGAWVTLWAVQEDNGSPFGIFRIYQRLYSSAGGAATGEIEVGATVSGEFSDPSAVALKNGGWVVTWSTAGSGTTVYQQVFSSGGGVLYPTQQVNTFEPNNQTDSRVTALNSGGWVVTWTSYGQDGDSSGIYQQAYTAAGAKMGSETRVNTTTPDAQADSLVVPLKGGGWVVTWVSTEDYTDRSVYGQAFDAAGNKLGVEVLIGGPSHPITQHTVTALTGGGWVAVWNGVDGMDTVSGQSVESTGVLMQVFKADGTVDGGPQIVNTQKAGVQALDGSLGRNHDKVIALADGGFVVTWTSDDGNGLGVYQRAFHPGTSGPTGIEGSLSIAEGKSGTVGTLVAVDPDSDTGFKWALVDDADHRFNISSTTGKVTVENALLLDYEQSKTHTIKVSVTDAEGHSLIKTLTVDVVDVASENLTGSSNADKFVGGSNADRFDGAGGNDTLSGGSGDDRLSGGTADDKLYGGSGLDLLTGETGDDLLDASTGNDRVYGNDGEDVLYGGTGNDQIYGGNHDDRLYGDLGADALTGGAGLDKFVYRTLSDSTSAASGRDTILDFTRGQGDKIHLSTLDANANKAGDQAFTFIGDDAFSKTAGELRYSQSGGNTYILADVNGDGASDFIIQFDLTRTFIATDFVL